MMIKSARVRHCFCEFQCIDYWVS